MNNSFYPEELAIVLCELAGSDIPSEQHECKDALYHLKAIAENEKNSDYFRTFWNVLQKLAEVYQQKAKEAPDMRIISRVWAQMTAYEHAKMMNILRASFPEYDWT